jgi:hypothetical protein
MRRSLALRIGTLILVVFTSTAPAFASPRDDSAFGTIGRAIERILQNVKRVIHPTDSLNSPK